MTIIVEGQSSNVIIDINKKIDKVNAIINRSI